MLYSAPRPKDLPIPFSAEHPFSPTLTTSGGSNFLSEFLDNQALPAQTIDFTKYQIKDLTALDGNDLSHQRHTVVTHDGARLDTLEINHESQKLLAPQYQTYIINFTCNFKSYEQSLEEMQDNARDLKTNVIGFNYRGVSLSEGHASSFRQ